MNCSTCAITILCPTCATCAAAILKVAAGWPICRVAASGLNKPHHEDTVRSWLNRYEQEGLGGLRVRQGARYNSVRPIAGCLNVSTGQLISRQRSTYPVQEMARFFRFVDQHFPMAQRIFLILDNWFVHFHPYVLDYLAKHCPRIELVPLPTYAPWTNPLEKVWLKLYRELLYHHPYDDDWEGLQQAVEDWLAESATDSQELLHSAGLLPELIC